MTTKRRTLSLKKKPAAAQQQPVPSGEGEDASRDRSQAAPAPGIGLDPGKATPSPSLEKALHLITTLEANHPDLFPTDERAPVLWAVGIHRHIMERYGVSKRVARKALKIWRQRSGAAYERVLAAGGTRFGLDGEAVGSGQTPQESSDAGQAPQESSDAGVTLAERDQANARRMLEESRLAGWIPTSWSAITSGEGEEPE